MAKIKEVAGYIRSKNAGPFWLTIDLFFDNEAKYQTLVDSPHFNQKALSGLFQVKEENIKIFYQKNLKVVKVSLPRRVIQGAPCDADMHGGQQYISILDMEL